MRPPLSLDALLEPKLWDELGQLMQGVTTENVRQALHREQRELGDLAALISPLARPFLDEMATRARSLTARRFGRTMILYVPLYISNSCVNNCTYCGFARAHDFKRRTLNLDEIDAEIARLQSEGFEHLLLLTGEDKRAVPVADMAKAVALCHSRVSSVSVEVYPMAQHEYAQLIDAGCDSLTLYQETYHQPTYKLVHPSGPKAHYGKRIAAPIAGAAAGMRSVSMGVLLGLADWRIEALYMALHGAYMHHKHYRTRLSFGFPRLRDDPGAGVPLQVMSEADLAQLIFAMRLVFADADLVISTRERPAFRDGMVGLGVTRMSAGSKTQPGGYSLDNGAGEQFAITDTRSPAEVLDMIVAQGYEPVWKDFDQGFLA